MSNFGCQSWPKFALHAGLAQCVEVLVLSEAPFAREIGSSAKTADPLGAHFVTQEDCIWALPFFGDQLSQVFLDVFQTFGGGLMARR